MYLCVCVLNRRGGNRGFAGCRVATISLGQAEAFDTPETLNPKP